MNTSVDEATTVQAEKDVREHKETLDAALEEHKKNVSGKCCQFPQSRDRKRQSVRSTRHFPQSSFTSGETGLPDRAA